MYNGVTREVEVFTLLKDDNLWHYRYGKWHFNALEDNKNSFKHRYILFEYEEQLPSTGCLGPMDIYMNKSLISLEK